MSVRVQLELPRPGFRLEVDTEFPGRGVSGLFGPSGSGKTTLLRALAGLERTARGRIEVGGETWQDATRFLPAHRRRVGFVFQEPSLFPHLRVRANLAYAERRAGRGPAALARDRAVDLLGIGHLLDRFPDQLSLGEQQRVALARTLASRPEILLLDEPLASLDAARKGEILPLLAELHESLRIPVLYVSHAPEEILALAEQVFLLREGRIEESGPVGLLAARLEGKEGPARGTLLAGRRLPAATGDGLVPLATPAGRILVPAGSLRGREEVRLLVRAEELGLAAPSSPPSSCLNELAGAVDTLEPVDPVRMAVQLRVGDARLSALLPRGPLGAMGLRPGSRVTVQLHRVTVLPGGPV